MGITMQIVIASGIAVILIIVIAVILRKRMGGRPVPPELMPGQPLPEFSALDENGVTLHSTDLRNQPTVILFVRGTWCPFCSKQVADLTKHYKDIEELGSRLILITPKPLETTRRVAEFYKVNFEFWLDESLEIAKRFGLVQTKGVPDDFLGEYGEDTVWPTSLVVDSDGIIRHTWLSKFIVDRPDPKTLSQAVRSIQESSSD
jgi:peroxiredoxin